MADTHAHRQRGHGDNDAIIRGEHVKGWLAD